MDSHRGARRQGCTPSVYARGGTTRSHDDGTRIDPGRLLETAFRERQLADDPETYVLAWLALMRVPEGALRAAAALAQRLSDLQLGVRSPWQRRLIELLNFIARYRRRHRNPAAALRSITSAAKKGMS